MSDPKWPPRPAGRLTNTRAKIATNTVGDLPPRPAGRLINMRAKIATTNTVGDLENRTWGVLVTNRFPCDRVAVAEPEYPPPVKPKMLA